MQIFGAQWQHSGDSEFTIWNQEWKEIAGNYLQRESHLISSQMNPALVILNIIP